MDTAPAVASAFVVSYVWSFLSLRVCISVARAALVGAVPWYILPLTASALVSLLPALRILHVLYFPAAGVRGRKPRLHLAPRRAAVRLR